MATGPLRQLQGDQFAQKVFNCGTKGHIPLEKRSSSLSFADTEGYIDQNFYHTPYYISQGCLLGLILTDVDIKKSDNIELDPSPLKLT